MSAVTLLFIIGKIYGTVCLAVLAFVLWRFRLPEKLIEHVTRKLFWSFFAVSLARIMWLYAAQYALWRGQPGAQYLLPPHQPVGYFLWYGWFRFARPECVSIAVTLFFCTLFWVLQRISKDRIFYADEIYTAGLGFLLNTWPQNILLIILVFGSGILLGLGRILAAPKTKPGAFYISTRFFWPLWAVILTYAGEWVVELLHLESLRL